MNSNTDEELVSLINNADSASRPRLLNELFRRHYQRVALWCLRFSGDRERAADWTQEIFIKVQRGLANFEGSSKFTTWLFTITRNHCISQLQSRVAQFEVTADVEWDDFVAETSVSAEDNIDRNRKLSSAREWITKLLDERERTVFVMHYVDGVPLDAIGRLLQLENASGAKAFIVSARRKLSEAARRWRSRHESI